MSIGSEIKKFGKKVKREVFRGGILDKHSSISKMIRGPEAPVPDPLPIPDPPIVQGTPGEGAGSRRKKLVKSGRGGSILAGSLTPKNIGKRILG